MLKEYNHRVIEEKWRKIWADSKIYHTDDVLAPDAEKFYCLDMFPGISGSHLHVGHFLGYTLSDVQSRYALLRGKHVLHPMGWDAFGLPVENFAVKNNVHPRAAKDTNKASMKAQLEHVAAMYDWDRELDTSDPTYYRWTQWFFLQLYKAGLAYRKEAPVNWCPKDLTVLANEQVVDGCCERCKSPVEKKNLKQWFFKITVYADRLEADLATIDWPERTKKMQRDWIGRSEGAELVFRLADREDAVRVFTTRPDTIFGATYLVLAPEHPLVAEISSDAQRSAVETYVKQVQRKGELERIADDKTKTGVFTGAFAINPATGNRIPIWIADYVLMSYGTGAIMAVPAHDERDNAFAKAYELPVVEVIERAVGTHADENADKIVTANDLPLKNSGKFDGMIGDEAKQAIIAWATQEKWGKAAVSYKMRDWLFSRQRYWGAPIPMIYCKTCGEVPVEESALPVLLPDVADFKPRDTGRSPLANVPAFVQTNCPKCGGNAERETDTMDGFVCSSWYFLRFTSPHDEHAPFSPEAVKSWMPVDLYVGGAEHSVGHLMYARFFTKFLFDQGLVDFNEPFKKLYHQGIIYRNGAKMSKSKGNVVNPDEIVDVFGADSLRCYSLFMGPADQSIEWSDRGIEGVYRFLARAYRMVMERGERGSENGAGDIDDAAREINTVINRVTRDIESFHFNTAISGMMEFVNEIKDKRVSVDVLERFVVLLAPFAPHIAEELWQELGHKTSVFTEGRWPVADFSVLAVSEVTIPVQINGKLRGTVVVAAGASEADVVARARELPNVAKNLEGKEVKKTIFVKDKIVGFVI